MSGGVVQFAAWVLLELDSALATGPLNCARHACRSRVPGVAFLP
jgi:hypothetical protein